MAQEQETEKDVGELENRLERLRILYEQYFMGIEKREPGVQHKDVERRIQQLRKIRFQSTAARFKFQTMVQRFNTLQQYWTRTCREIENGTYKRHIQRATRRLATVPPTDGAQDELLLAGAERAKLRDEVQADLGALLDEKIDLEAEMKGALAALEKEKAPAPKPLGALGAKKDGESLPRSPTLHLGKAVPLKTLSPEAKPSISPRLSTSPKPAGLAPLPQRSTTSNPLAALGKANPPSGAAAPPVPQAPAKAGPPLAPSLRPQAGRAPAQPPAPAAPAPARVQAATPPVPAQPVRAPTVPTPARARPALPNEAGLSGDRIKALHESYVEARRKTNASPVSFEKLEKNIRETEKKLRAEHKGRQIDFEVSIKDGKAILKPRLK